jgi:hypothetical protein
LAGHQVTNRTEPKLQFEMLLPARKIQGEFS